MPRLVKDYCGEQQIDAYALMLEVAIPSPASLYCHTEDIQVLLTAWLIIPTQMQVPSRPD